MRFLQPSPITPFLSLFLAFFVLRLFEFGFPSDISPLARVISSFALLVGATLAHLLYVWGRGEKK